MAQSRKWANLRDIPLYMGATHLLCTFVIDLKTLSVVRIHKAPDFWMILNNAVEGDMEGTGRRII